MPTEIITQDDLRDFKLELLEDIQLLLTTAGAFSQRKYIKSGELMKFLQVSTSTLQTLRINGSLPYTKMGGIIYFDMEDVTRYMDENKIQMR